MNSGLANNLVQVQTNLSVVAGSSLIAESPSFAFQNDTTPESVLVECMDLPTPLDPALTTFRSTVEPFDVVDLRRILPLLQTLCRLLWQEVLGTLSWSDEIQHVFQRMAKQNIFLPPSPGIRPRFEAAISIEHELRWLPFAATHLTVPTHNVVKTVVASGLHNSNASTWAAVAARHRAHKSSTLTLLNETIALLTTFSSPTELIQLQSPASSTKAYIRDAGHLKLVQCIGDADGLEVHLSHVNVFAGTESVFEFYVWLYFVDWVKGAREVVAFQGDSSSRTTLSAPQKLDAREYRGHPSQRLELPRPRDSICDDCAPWRRLPRLCLYWHEPRAYPRAPHDSFSNIVWSTQPLVLFRGLTGLGFLSTVSLELVQRPRGLVHYFESVVPSLVWTLLSVGDTTWIVYVIVDLSSVATNQYSRSFSMQSAVFVSLASAAWSLASPTTHRVAVARTCFVVAVDFDVVCSGSSMEIGNASRFLVNRHNRVRMKLLSFFLYAAAKNRFEPGILSSWEHDGVYYLDKASAVLTGLVTMELRGTLHIFDSKSWRHHCIAPSQTNARGPNVPLHLQHAIPLIE
ncbi:Aste57867_17739 [Aphanomyces stellatus]|uniref:Aste57867_17739 protein n=1 Tax=Aphanomyces stellatus TaxID=120398 RepID=A0A485L8G3_9STRA|nr:hypothetical protein As57867_017678 [Aphanomyces stellatus]VFT94485.1 Aste57867_17739 [Aphanomyces stellatus]